MLLTQISIQIEVGKILFVKLQAVSDADAEGMRQVVFELNGQQRVIKVSKQNSSYN
jgi:pyruvate carboxylase